MQDFARTAGFAAIAQAVADHGGAGPQNIGRFRVSRCNASTNPAVIRRMPVVRILFATLRSVLFLAAVVCVVIVAAALGRD